MGTCWNCNTQISLGEERTRCDNCHTILYYHCNNCSKRFNVEDKKTKKKLVECKLCGYFKCPYCQICSWNCAKYMWEIDILKILKPEITQGNTPIIMKKVREIVNLFEQIRGGKERRIYSERKVLISYAKYRIKSLLAKVEGFRVKDEDDRDAFLKRLEEVTDKDMGTELKITDIREDGSYGQEYRDAFNLSVCMGKLKIEKKSFEKDGETIEYDSYIRIEGEPCKYLAQDDLILNECKTCKKRYNSNVKFCSICPPYTKGNNAGQFRKLKKRLNDKDICQLPRSSFHKKF